MRAHPRARDRRDLPGPADLAQSALHGRPADRRDDPHAPADERDARRATRAIALLEEVGIPGGRRGASTTTRTSSRAACASASSSRSRSPRKPKLIIADEPTTALDVSIQAQIIQLLKRLCRDHGTAVMLVTHDMGVIAETADRVAVMYAGRIVEIGPVADVIHRPQHPYTVGLMGSIPSIGATRRAPARRSTARCRGSTRSRRAARSIRAARARSSAARASGPSSRPVGADARRVLARRRCRVEALRMTRRQRRHAGAAPAAATRSTRPSSRATSTSRRRGSTACSSASRACC